MSLSGTFASAVPGGGSVEALLQAMVSTENFAEKMKEFAAAKAEAERFVQLIGPAESIPVLHEKARAAASEAAKSLGDARKEAGSIVSDARKEAALLVSEATKRAASLVSDAQKQLAESETLVSGARARASVITAEAEQIKNSASAELRVLKDRLLLTEEEHAECSAAKAEATAVKARLDSLVAKTKAIWSDA